MVAAARRVVPTSRPEPPTLQPLNPPFDAPKSRRCKQRITVVKPKLEKPREAGASAAGFFWASLPLPAGLINLAVGSSGVVGQTN
jgi:hypothetical protein